VWPEAVEKAFMEGKPKFRMGELSARIPRTTLSLHSFCPGAGMYDLQYWGKEQCGMTFNMVVQGQTKGAECLHRRKVRA